MEMIKRIEYRAFLEYIKSSLFMLKKILLFFIALPYQSTVIKVYEVDGTIMNWFVVFCY